MPINLNSSYGAASCFQEARQSNAFAPDSHAVCPLICAAVASIRDVARDDAVQTHAELDQLLVNAQGAATTRRNVLAARAHAIARFAQDQAKGRKRHHCGFRWIWSALPVDADQRAGTGGDFVRLPLDKSGPFGTKRAC